MNKSMMYINTRGAHGVETIDDLDEKDFKSKSEYNRIKKYLLNEHKKMHKNKRVKVYLSQRSTIGYNRQLAD